MNNLDSLPYLPPVSQIEETDELPEGAVEIKIEEKRHYSVSLTYRIPYCMHEGTTLYMDIYRPVPFDGGLPTEPGDEASVPVYPLIVFVQGSGWLKQDIGANIAQHIYMCQKGYVVAVPEYRPSDVCPFPGHMEDIKTAVRFMKKHAAEYKCDPEKVAIWGCSSGGHVALMTGITGDEEECGSEYSEYSCEVKAIVDWYGPTDILHMACWPSAMDHNDPASPEGLMLGGVYIPDHPDLARKADPIQYLRADKKTPPILIMHGGFDEKVPFHQSVQLYEKLKELGKSAKMYKLTGAGHGPGGFRSDEACDIVDDFIKEALGI